MKEVRQIPKAHVEVASRGRQPRFRYIGTKKMPPPRPKPLKIPAPMLILTSYAKCYWNA